MSKHTKGPWMFDRETWTIRVPFTTISPKECEFMADYRGGVIADFSESHGKRAEAFAAVEANARLIAAAPEMLEALKYALGCATGTERDYCGTLEKKMSDAIAKAEGRE